ncbi:TonB-dependent receptor, partial [Sphingomonas sp.]|uniref:TonB-dependent receptor n=1 Tax=Sphingomonas sp. TaxID=28214 RepID=UPI0025F4B774
MTGHSRRAALASTLLLLLGASSSEAWAQADPDNPQKNEIVVYGRALKQIGKAQSGSQGTVGYADFKDKPLGRVGELVENVPGVIATQHSGTGKANQYFLRGFNLDHGTDFAGFVDGVPVNMRTHGHGQGYMDLNFLIPELVQRIDYRKGPYFADVGDFSAAGTVKFRTADTLPAPIVQATLGSYGYDRALTAGSTSVGRGNLLVGLDGTLSNGPWVLDEKLRKFNSLIKYSEGTPSEGWSLGLTAYRATWNSTDQVPQRAIEDGEISRYGNIDPYLGGATTRIGLTGNAAFDATQINLFALYYRFHLISNFTYFLDDPVHGDEFEQRDQRGVFGGSLHHDFPTTVAGLPVTFTIGGDARYDHIGKVGLYHTEKGRIIGTVRQDRVDELSGAAYIEGSAALTDRLRVILGLRGDLYNYDVHAETLAANSGQGSEAILSPKAAVAWHVADHVELYADYGEGFHSNDVRGATIKFDPRTFEPADQVPALVKARGAELGGRVEVGRFTGSLVGYYLALGSELVYSGDGGTTEPNAATRRYGAEATIFWRPADWLTLDAAGSLTHARFVGVDPGQAHVPNSIGRVLTGGAEAQFGHGFSASLRVRHFGSAPLIEDNSARSRPTTLVNAGSYWRGRRLSVSVDILNVLNSHANDITYYYASRLPGEPADGVDDYHLHPVEP